MKLDKVTLTGADDSADPIELVKLSEAFPFVEWGILFIHNGHGNRFPSPDWVDELLRVATPVMNLCAHLCEGWTGPLMRGDFTFGELPIAKRFQRVQVNFHGAKQFPGMKLAKMLATTGKEFMFQVDGVNDNLVFTLSEMGLGCPLFDISGGAGILPDAWPKALKGVYCGYAGGLSPENTRSQVLGPIAVAAGDERIWIDMETKIRSKQDRTFDLNKCRAVLESVKDLVTPA